MMEFTSHLGGNKKQQLLSSSVISTLHFYRVISDQYMSQIPGTLSGREQHCASWVDKDWLFLPMFIHPS